jgi:hypothetical protein
MENGICRYKSAVIGANLCARDPLEVKGKGIRAIRVVADKEAYTVHSINIISQRQYFVARCLSSYAGNVFGLHSTGVPNLRTGCVRNSRS